ncbi:MAG: hypothetical protein N4A35_16810 [Flavobacteriales bacterium]|jgi:tetratricopeptide (TPR) repeat protein|nr:hypothetical protein [Flavobacteriales bacterium]
MKVKNYISFLLATVFVGLSSYGQNYNKYCLYTDYSVKAYEKGAYKKAIALMDSAIINCKEENDNAVNWYNLSLYYKAYYKQSKDLSLREKILEITLKAQEKDVNNELEPQLKSSLRNLANTYKNELNLYLNDTSGVFLAKAVEKHGEYKSVYRLADQEKDFTKEDVLVFNILGSRYDTKYSNNKEKYRAYLDSSILYYSKSIELDSNQAEIYNAIGLIYFNQAVDIINALDYEADLQMVMESDAKKADLAMKGLPYFEKALNADPNNGEIIYALAGCYKILNFDEKYRTYLEMLKEKAPDYYNAVYTFD